MPVQKFTSDWQWTVIDAAIKVSLCTVLLCCYTVQLYRYRLWSVYPLLRRYCAPAIAFWVGGCDALCGGSGGCCGRNKNRVQHARYGPSGGGGGTGGDAVAAAMKGGGLIPTPTPPPPSDAAATPNGTPLPPPPALPPVALPPPPAPLHLTRARIRFQRYGFVFSFVLGCYSIDTHGGLGVYSILTFNILGSVCFSFIVAIVAIWMKFGTGIPLPNSRPAATAQTGEPSDAGGAAVATTRSPKRGDGGGGGGGMFSAPRDPSDDQLEPVAAQAFGTPRDAATAAAAAKAAAGGGANDMVGALSAADGGSSASLQPYAVRVGGSTRIPNVAELRAGTGPGNYAYRWRKRIWLLVRIMCGWGLIGAVVASLTDRQLIWYTCLLGYAGAIWAILCFGYWMWLAERDVLKRYYELDRERHRWRYASQVAAAKQKRRTAAAEALASAPSSPRAVAALRMPAAAQPQQPVIIDGVVVAPAPRGGGENTGSSLLTANDPMSDGGAAAAAEAQRRAAATAAAVVAAARPQTNTNAANAKNNASTPVLHPLTIATGAAAAGMTVGPGAAFAAAISVRSPTAKTNTSDGLDIGTDRTAPRPGDAKAGGSSIPSVENDESVPVLELDKIPVAPELVLIRSMWARLGYYLLAITIGMVVVTLFWIDRIRELTIDTPMELPLQEFRPIYATFIAFMHLIDIVICWECWLTTPDQADSIENSTVAGPPSLLPAAAALAAQDGAAAGAAAKQQQLQHQRLMIQQQQLLMNAQQQLQQQPNAAVAAAAAAGAAAHRQHRNNPYAVAAATAAAAAAAGGGGGDRIQVRTPDPYLRHMTPQANVMGMDGASAMPAIALVHTPIAGTASGIGMNPAGGGVVRTGTTGGRRLAPLPGSTQQIPRGIHHANGVITIPIGAPLMRLDQLQSQPLPHQPVLTPSQSTGDGNDHLQLQRLPSRPLSSNLLTVERQAGATGGGAHRSSDGMPAATTAGMGPIHTPLGPTSHIAVPRSGGGGGSSNAGDLSRMQHTPPLLVPGNSGGISTGAHPNLMPSRSVGHHRTVTASGAGGGVAPPASMMMSPVMAALAAAAGVEHSSADGNGDGNGGGGNGGGTAMADMQHHTLQPPPRPHTSFVGGAMAAVAAAAGATSPRRQSTGTPQTNGSVLATPTEDGMTPPHPRVGLAAPQLPAALANQLARYT